MAKKKKQKQPSGEKPAVADRAATVRVTAHPRARTSIRRWRGRAGMVALIVVTVLSLRAGVPAFDAVLRGLAGGVVAQFSAWAAGVVCWRHLIMAELAQHRDKRAAALAEQRAAASAAKG